jgi:predicted ATPase
MGAALFSLSDFVQARRHLEQSAALYDPQEPQATILLYGYNLGIACLARLAVVLWFLGYPDQAVQKSEAALAHARDHTHPFSLAFALSFASECYRLRRDARATQAQAEATIALSTVHGFSLWEAGASIYRGWVLAEQGQTEEGIGQLQHGIAAWQAAGAAIGMPALLAQLAEAYGHAGRVEKGLAVLNRALETVQQTGEAWWEAELYRLQRELTLSQSSVQSTVFRVREAEGCFLKAIQITQKQQAKSLELRAVMSLSRLWRQHGKQDEARQLLTEIYSWFTEGFATKDLQEAKALLAELA